MNAELIDAHRAGKLMLFVGSGVSANLGLPNWNQLIAHIATELGTIQKYFLPTEQHSLAEFYKKKKGGIGQLRSWMDREWHPKTTDISTSDIHRFITAGNFSRIYTTNYDRWLESAHEAFGVPFDKIASVADLVSVTDGRRQIVKFQGDFDDDDSIVLDGDKLLSPADFRYATGY